MSQRFVVVIPSRMTSMRLPGKPLALVAGRPLVLRVLDVARASGADEVYVATDDARIEACVQAEGASVVMTSAEHLTGTDRLAEVAAVLGFDDDAIVVNLQGDEPFIPPGLLGSLAQALTNHPRAGVATIATPIASRDELFESSVVKTVLDAGGFALYFSRAPIPFVRGAFEGAEAGGHNAPLPAGVRFLRHLGIYAYRASTLRALSTSAASEAETAESLEQLRAMHLGIPIHVTVVDHAPLRGVDTPEDLARAARVFGQSKPLAPTPSTAGSRR